MAEKRFDFKIRFPYLSYRELENLEVRQLGG
jgi:hypothetical protein